MNRFIAALGAVVAVAPGAMAQTQVVESVNIEMPVEESPMTVGEEVDGEIVEVADDSGVTHGENSAIPSLDYDYNPIVQRLGEAERESCNTPAAVAYEFVMAAIRGDKEEMIHLSDYEYGEYIDTNYQRLMNEFRSDGKLNLMHWDPVPEGFEITPLAVQTEYDVYRKVYIDCIPSHEIGNTGFQDVSRDMMTNVKVMLTDTGERWVVTGFK